MKKIYLSTIAILIVFTVYLGFNPHVARAFGNFIRSGLNLPAMTGAIFTMESNATSTISNYLLTGTGTTTLTFPSENFSSVTVYMKVIASSTSGAYNSPITIQPYASDENIDFFPYNAFNRQVYTATSSIELASTTVAFTYIPATINATTSTAFNVNLIPARYTQLQFYIGASTTPWTQRQSAAIWVNVVGQAPNGY